MLVGLGSSRTVLSLTDWISRGAIDHCDRAQGKGIFLFTKLSQISDWKTDYRWHPENQQVETYVVQKYISNPYLVGGKKVCGCGCVCHDRIACFYGVDKCSHARYRMVG